MPVEAKFIEKGIYLSKWVGVISGDEVVLSQEQVLALADEHGDEKYVLIIDATQFKRVQLTFQSVRDLMKRNNKRLLGYIVVGMTFATQIVSKSFSVVVQLPYHFAHNEDEAREMALRILADYRDNPR